MTDLTKLSNEEKIAAITTRLVEAHKERADREASANAHEAAAREDRLAMTALKKEIGELTAVLQHSQVQKNVMDAQGMAAKAKAEAEATAAKMKQDAEAAEAKQAQVLADLEAKGKQLDELIAKAQASQAATEAPAIEPSKA